MPKNKLAYTRQAKGETLYQIFQRTGFRVARLSDIERGFALPTLDETVQLAEIYGISRSEVAKITNAGWEGKDIKEQVEQRVSLGIAIERAWNRNDHAAVNNAIIDKNNAERDLYSKDVAILPNQEDTNVLHVYINGERWKDFDTVEWQWKAIEEQKCQ